MQIKFPINFIRQYLEVETVLREKDPPTTLQIYGTDIVPLNKCLCFISDFPASKFFPASNTILFYGKNWNFWFILSSLLSQFYAQSCSFKFPPFSTLCDFISGYCFQFKYGLLKHMWNHQKNKLIRLASNNCTVTRKHCGSSCFNLM